MYITLFRTGIWVIIATLAAYVIRETYLGEMLVFLNEQLLQRALMLGAGAIGLGVLAWIGSKIFPKKKGHCKICRQSIPPGAIYCRIHLRDVLEKARHTEMMPRER